MPFLQFKDLYRYITDDEAKLFNTLVIPDQVKPIFGFEFVDVDENDFQALLSLIHLNILKPEVCKKYVDENGGIKSIDNEVVKFIEEYYVQDIELGSGLSVRTGSKSVGDIFALWDCVLNISNMFCSHYDRKTKINSFGLDVLKGMIIKYLEPMQLKSSFIIIHPIRGPECVGF